MPVFQPKTRHSQGFVIVPHPLATVHRRLLKSPSGHDKAPSMTGSVALRLQGRYEVVQVLQKRLADRHPIGGQPKATAPSAVVLPVVSPTQTPQGSTTAST